MRPANVLAPSARSKSRKQWHPVAGFTLLEIMLALFIFAIVMMIASSGFTIAIRAEKQVGSISERLATLQIAEAIISRDVSQMVNRSIVDVDGTLLAPILVDTRRDTQFEFTRGGVINPLAQARRSSMMRVAYELYDGQLIRKTWRVLDRAPSTQADVRVLLNNVEQFALYFLNEQNEFVSPTTGAFSALPRAVQLDLTLDGKILSRIIKINAKTNEGTTS